MSTLKRKNYTPRRYGRPRGLQTDFTRGAVHVPKKPKRVNMGLVTANIRKGRAKPKGNRSPHIKVARRQSVVSDRKLQSIDPLHLDRKRQDEMYDFSMGNRPLPQVRRIGQVVMVPRRRLSGVDYKIADRRWENSLDQMDAKVAQLRADRRVSAQYVREYKRDLEDGYSMEPSLAPSVRVPGSDATGHPMITAPRALAAGMAGAARRVRKKKAARREEVKKIVNDPANQRKMDLAMGPASRRRPNIRRIVPVHSEL